MKQWKVVKIEDKGDFLSLETLDGKRITCLKVFESEDDESEWCIGAGISLEKAKRIFPECSDGVVSILLDYFMNDAVDLEFEEYGKFMLSSYLIDDIVIYDKETGHYYLKDELTNKEKK